MLGRISRSLLSGLIATAVLMSPVAGHTRSDPECGRGGKPIFANITQPAGGSLTVYTATTGPIVVDGTGLSVAISTTGNVDVVVHFSCIMNMTLTVSKNDPSSGPAVVHTHDWSDADLNGDGDGPCVEGEATTSVPIGIDGGEYRFQLSGMGCNGLPIKDSGHGTYVGDPPLGI